MDLVRTELVAAALLVGIAALALATTIATRHDRAPDRRRRWSGLAPLVPWLGGLLVLLLLVRGATAAAVVVALATVVHAVVVRLRALFGRR